MSIENHHNSEQNEDLKLVENVVKLMESSKNENEWNANCDKVKKSNDSNYPDFWYKAIVISGVTSKTQATWHK